MYNERIINTFLALYSQKIVELERLKAKGETPITIKVIDILPTKEEKELLETNLLNMLVEQGWEIRGFNLMLEQPAIIKINFNLYL